MDLSADPNRSTPVSLQVIGQIAPFKSQLLKWVGNKQRYAHEIISFFPKDFETYHEPFLGSGAVLATLAPRRARAADAYAPLMEIWSALVSDPQTVKRWYAERYAMFQTGDRVTVYETVKRKFNTNPNGADLLFISRTCYGGVVRFRKKDGYMSTPCGAHPPMPPKSFARRVDMWVTRIQGARFDCSDYQKSMRRARSGDLIYCDPPYANSQSILYGAQRFDIQAFFKAVLGCKRRGVRVAVSLDGSKKSGAHHCPVAIPDDLFERQVAVNVGRSMLKRFQMGGRTLENEVVRDRLLLTY